VSSPELAEAIVRELNGRTDLDYAGNELEYYLRPRFGIAEEADSALQISAQRCIDLIGRGKAPDVRASKAALAMGRIAMGIADEMLQAAARLTPTEVAVAPPAIPVAPGEKQSEGEAGTSTKKRRGRTPDTDPKEDKRIADAWKTGRYRTYEACGREFGMTGENIGRRVKLAVDRHRKRPQKRRKNSRR